MNVSVESEFLWNFILDVIESCKSTEHFVCCNDWLMDLKRKKVINYLQWKDLNQLNQAIEYDQYSKNF